MQIKRFFKLALIAAVAIVATTAITACKDDDDDKNSLSGWYTTNPEQHGWFDVMYCYGYNFINENTVIYYDELAESETPNSFGTVTIAGKRWYHSNAVTYTYTRNDNKIYIPMKGVILTISGNSLFEDGIPNVFHKR